MCLHGNRLAWEYASSKTTNEHDGSCSGIGFEIIRRLSKEFDGDVYLTAREASNGLKAVVTLIEADGLRPKFHQMDITSCTCKIR